MSELRRWSLRSRLLGSLVTLTALLFVAGAVQNYFVNRETNSRLFDDSLRESAGLLLQLAQHEIAEHGQLLGIAMLKAETRPGPYGFQFQIWTRDMQAGFRSEAVSTTPLMRFETEGFGWTQINQERWRAYSMWSHDRALQIQIAQPQRQRQALNRAEITRMSAGVLLLLCVAFLLIRLILTRSIEPLRETALTVSQRSENDLRPVDAPHAPAEVAPLVEALNRLLERVGAALQRERRFTADAAHELRTPLAAIRLNAQVLVGARDRRERETTARDLIASVDRSTRLVEQLLALARADAVLQPEALLDADLAAIASEQVLEQTDAALQADLLLRADLQPAVVRGDRALLAVLLRNLLENALRYTPSGSILVATGTGPEGARLEVIDTGSGIPMADRPRIFERFFRVPGLQASGSGLGLSIVRRIADLHGASIEVLEGEGNHGTRIRVNFPQTAS
ncbi:MAG: ATP-binding protein [Pseudomonadota bacterium]